MDASGKNELLETVQRLEERIARLERYLGFSAAEKRVSERKKGVAAHGEKKDMELEFRIGEYWFSRLGAIFLLIGAGFFISYPLPGLPPIVVSLLGYVSIGILFSLSRYWKSSFTQLSRLIFAGCLILLFYATLHLHYYTENPLIASQAVGTVLLLITLAVELFFVHKRKDPLLFALVLMLFLVGSLTINLSQLSLAIFAVTAILAAITVIRYDWFAVGFLGLVATFLAQALWLAQGPLAGQNLGLLEKSQYNLLYLVLYGATFGLLNVFRKEKLPDFHEVLFCIVNGTGIMAVGAINLFSYFKSDVALLAGLTFLLFFILAVLNQGQKGSLYSSSIYANFAFIALSIAIFAQFDFPNYFIWFGMQSLLVIIVALWFQSPIIVIANALIFLLIFSLYLFLSPSNGYVNLSYTIAAFASARTLNWKKERLALRTDKIRNTYLGCVFLIVLYGLFHAAPMRFVSLAWIAAAVGYFLLGLLLKNIKYRYLAILTIFATIIHVFLIDLRTVQAGFRIVLFLAIGIIILVLSLLYTEYHKKLNLKKK